MYAQQYGVHPFKSKVTYLPPSTANCNLGISNITRNTSLAYWPRITPSSGEKEYSETNEEAVYQLGLRASTYSVPNNGNFNIKVYQYLA